MVFVFLADGFEETEAIAPVDVMRRCGVEVYTVGVDSKTVTSSHKVTVTADLSADECLKKAGKLEGVVLPGGMPGTLNLEKSELVQSFVKKAHDDGLILGAICAAPSILGHLGYLDGKKATCFPGFEKDLLGASYVNEPAVTDGTIITGKGAGAAIEFGLALSAKLCGADKAQKVRESMQCP